MKNNTCPHCTQSTLYNPCPSCGNETLCTTHGCYIGCPTTPVHTVEFWGRVPNAFDVFANNAKIGVIDCDGLVAAITPGATILGRYETYREAVAALLRAADICGLVLLPTLWGPTTGSWRVLEDGEVIGRVRRDICDPTVFVAWADDDNVVSSLYYDSPEDAARYLARRIK